MIAIGLLIVGILGGMWLGKHPEDARAYGEALWARAKSFAARFKKTP